VRVQLQAGVVGQEFQLDGLHQPEAPVGQFVVHGREGQFRPEHLVRDELQRGHLPNPRQVRFLVVPGADGRHKDRQRSEAHQDEEGE
jgi:hypothetical protein